MVENPLSDPPAKPKALAPTVAGVAEEYERQPVPEQAVKPLRTFLGIFASEHVAATELLIGPLFVVHGVGAFDLLVGLLLGNFLAVLSWTYLTAPMRI